MQNNLPDYLQVVANKIDEFTTEIASLTEIEKSLSTKLRVCEDENSKLTSVNTTLQHEKEEVSEQSEIDKQALKEINATLSEQLRASNDKNSTLDKEGVSASEEVMLLKKEINTLRITTEALREKNNHLEHNHTLDAEVSENIAHEDADEKLLEEIETLKKELKEASIDNGVLQDQHIQFKELYVKAGEEKIAIASQFKALNDSNTALSEENKNLSENKTFLLANKEKIENMNAQLIKDKIDLSAKTDELERAKKSLEDLNSTLEHEVAQLRTKVDEINTQNEQLNVFNTTLASENKSLLQKSKMLADINSNLVSESLAKHDE